MQKKKKLNKNDHTLVVPYFNGIDTDLVPDVIRLTLVKNSIELGIAFISRIDHGKRERIMKEEEKKKTTCNEVENAKHVSAAI